MMKSEMMKAMNDVITIRILSAVLGLATLFISFMLYDETASLSSLSSPPVLLVVLGMLFSMGLALGGLLLLLVGLPVTRRNDVDGKDV